jgi:hypothetical protein
MNGGPYYRGGASLAPRPIDLRFIAGTGLLRTGRGVSVYDRPDGLARYGGAYEVTQIPPELHVVQIGRDPHHHEIAPVLPMIPAEYEWHLRRIVLVRV